MALRNRELGAIAFLLHDRFHPYYHLFNSTFQLMRADTQELRDRAHSLRYQVFCVENQLLNPENYPDGLEKDSYDDHAECFVLMHRHTHMVVGAIRMIFPEEHELGSGTPIYNIAPEVTKYCLAKGEAIPEISRFCISKEFRRQITDTSVYEGIRDINHMTDRPVAWLTQISLPMMSLGLLRAVIEMALIRQKKCAFGMIEPFLLNLLSEIEMPFERIGPIVEYLNARQPIFLDAREVFDKTRKHRPDVYGILSDNGRLYEML